MSLSYITLPPAKITHVGLPDPKDLPQDAIVQYVGKTYRVSNDELVEVTPTNIRIRKKYLDPTQRKRMSR